MYFIQNEILPFLESGAAAGVSKCLTEKTTTATVTNEEEHQELL